MQTSPNPADWKENFDENRERLLAGPHTDPRRLRQLWPFSGKVLPAAADTIVGAAPGTILRYVRTKTIPSSFPIEALLITGRFGRNVMFTQMEIEIFLPLTD